jgi:hypothetical protein
MLLVTEERRYIHIVEEDGELWVRVSKDPVETKRIALCFKCASTENDVKLLVPTVSLTWV